MPFSVQLKDDPTRESIMAPTAAGVRRAVEIAGGVHYQGGARFASIRSSSKVV